MNFYQALQLPPVILKNKMKTGENIEDKRFYRRALVLRSFLMVAFSIAFILLMTAMFGQEQSTLAVVLLCMLLSLRLVDFGYRVEQGLLGLGLVFFLLLVGPQLAEILPPFWKFTCHFISLLSIFLITSYDRQLGNPNLYSFCYIFLVGTLPGVTFFAARSVMMLLTYVIFTIIYFIKHRGKHEGIHFHQRVFKGQLLTENNQFLFILAFGVSLFFLLIDYYPLERYMWAGFACSSLLAGNREQLTPRSLDRVMGAILGSLGFFALMYVLPSQWVFLIGPLGGFVLGLVTTYRNQTIVNCFGALFLAHSIYGVETAVSLRIWDNVFGVLFALAYLLSLRLLYILYRQAKVYFLREVE